MEIVDFSGKTFREIPEQDNPAYQATEKCLMIVKQLQQELPYVNAGKLVVLLIEPVPDPYEQESVTQLGLFWELEDAMLFAKAYSEVN